MDWSLILFLLKWVLLGLVYVVLGLLLVGVIREMRLRVPQTASQSSAVSIGRLRVIQSGSDPRLSPGAVLVLRPDSLVGTKQGCTIILRDLFISGEHARLYWDGVAWWIEDLNSTNGTFINQNRIPPGVAEPLAYGAILQMGDMMFEMIE
ncbi:MAG: FHA domain-containing protein [Anaerolineaceae bacterium]|nr:FHA domain-containing protein [Anaerolineaceae bacterium]